MKTVPESVQYIMKTIKFEHRHSLNLEARLSRTSAKCRLSRAALAEKAILSAREFWRQGYWHPRRRSCFLERKEKSNKVTVWLRLSQETHQLLKKMALARQISLAEMLRLALELFTSRILNAPAQGRGILSCKPQPCIRILGINILDNLDRKKLHIGGVLSFTISRVHEL